MNLIDVHCHLNQELFKKDLDQVLQRAEKAGVKAILVSGVNPPANQEVQKLAEKYPIIKWSYGIYPIDALGLEPDETGLPVHKGPINLEQEFAFIKKNVKNITAIGEVGMDFHWTTKEKTGMQQEENFRKIIRFAISIKKPLVIHSREAEEECITILEEEIKHHEIPVIQHCFSGRKSLMSKAAALGHYFSIPPNILVSSNFQTLVQKTDIKQLLTETDAPWLSPKKGERNEPANVLKTIQKIAEIKKLTSEQAAKQIWENYLSLL